MQLVGERFSEVIHTERGDNFIRWQLLDQALWGMTQKEGIKIRSQRSRDTETNEAGLVTQRATDYHESNSTLFRMQSVWQSVPDKCWQMTHQSNQPDSKLHGSLRGRTRAVVSKASTLSRLPSGFPPLPLPAPRLVSNRSWVLRRLSAAQLLQSALPSSHG